MSAITKERIKLFIKNPLDNGLTRGEQMELARIALASLEAEAVAVRARWKDEGSGHGDWRYYNIAHRDALMADETRECELIYTAPPALAVPVVPTALPENDDEDGHDIDYLEPSEVYSLGRTAGWNACRAAILQGAEPVSNPYTLPANSFTDEELEGMAHGDNPQANVYRELLAYRTGEKK